METHVTASDDTEHQYLVATATDLITAVLNGTYSQKGNAATPRTRVEGDLVRHGYLTGGLQSYAATTLQKIIDVRADNLCYWHYSIIDLIIRGDVPLKEAFVSDYLHLSHCFDTTVLPKRIVEAILAFESFNYYDGMTPQHLGHEYPAKRVEQGTAILTIVTHMRRTVSSGVTEANLLSGAFFKSTDETLRQLVEDHSNDLILYIGDEKLRSLIISPDVDLAEITKIITERNLLNPVDIIAVLEAQESNPSRAVSNGIL